MKALFQDAVHATNSGSSTTDFEQSFETLLNFIELHPSHREEFEATMIRSLTSGDEIPHELISFCMHRLRWAGLKQIVDFQLRAGPDLRRRAVLLDIQRSYDDDWEDRDLYRIYRNSENPVRG